MTRIGFFKDGLWVFAKSRVIPGTSNNGTPETGKRDPYYSHISWDFYGSGMGIVWGPRGPMSLGVIGSGQLGLRNGKINGNLRGIVR